MSKDDLISTLESILENQEPNLITMSDAYKYSHHKFYPDGMTQMKSYLESRGGKFQELVMFGLQYMMKKYLVGPVLSMEMVEEAYEKLSGENGVFGRDDVFSRDKWEALIEKHGGRLPIQIKSAPEGTIIPVKNVMLMIENTDEEFAWVTNFVETLILQIWYPITVASLSREVKKVVIQYLRETGCSEEAIPMTAEFVLNDFGMRGVSSIESAGIGGAAHLVNFMGSDNLAGSEMLMNYYNAKMMWGKSIPATEHSVMTLKGEEGEIEMMKRTLEAIPSGLVACVSDSYNIFRACSQYWGTELRDLVLSRDGVLIIRPDSGHVTRTLLEIFDILFDKFGYTTNDKGFKVLPPQVRVIQGDGVNYDSICDMYAILKENKIAAENLALGMGGKLLQSGIDRDTQNFAIKACHAIINGEHVDVVKAPTEMDADGNIHASFKKSKKGDMKLVVDGNSYRTMMSHEDGFAVAIDVMKVVFRNGELLIDEDIVDIRERVSVLDIIKTSEPVVA